MAFSFGFFADAPAAGSAAAPADAVGRAHTQRAAGVADAPFCVLSAFPADEGGWAAAPVADDLGLTRAVALEPDAVSGGSLDVVPGKYEGGGKVWECTLDLLRFLHGLPLRAVGTPFPGPPTALPAPVAVPPVLSSVRGGVVCDLGCGAGLLGVAAARAGARHVLWQVRVTAGVAGADGGGGGGDLAVV
jgi:hypothetical protein